MSDVDVMRVIHLYAEPNRFYHDFIHVARMLQEWERVKHHLEPDPLQDKLMKLAILYHDVVYSTSRSLQSETNEAASCDLFRSHFTGIAGGDATATVERLIMCTQKHFSLYKPADDWEGIMMDLDLMSFADPYEVFVKTQDNLIKEITFGGAGEAVAKEQHVQFLEYLHERNLLKFFVHPKKKILTSVGNRNIVLYINEYRNKAW